MIRERDPSDSPSSGRSDEEGTGGVRALLVEDDRDSRAVIQALLSQVGLGVVAVPDAEEGFRQLDAGPFDILILDIALPGMSGADFLRAVRNRGGSYNTIPALAVTAFDSPTARAHLDGAGFDAYLVKPVDLKSILFHVVRLLPPASAHRLHFSSFLPAEPIERIEPVDPGDLDSSRALTWHSPLQQIHHDHLECEGGKAVRPSIRLEGSGGKPLCERCARLGRERRSTSGNG